MITEETELNVTQIMYDLKKKKSLKYSRRSRNILKCVCKVAIYAWYTDNLKLQ